MAQLDNAADSDSEERGFESLWAGQKNHQPLWLVVFFLVGKGFEPIVHLASVRLGGDARDIKCDGSHSERTRAEHKSLWACQKEKSH